MLAGGAELELECQEEGRGRRRHPQTYNPPKFSCLRQDLPEATVTGSQKPERSPGVGAATGSRGQLEALIPVPPSHSKAQNRSSVQSDNSEANTQGLL